MNKKYDNIINQPHHVSKNHPQMTMHQRAAQFAPFAALSGHSDALSESARITDEQMELSDYEKSILDRKLALLTEHISEHPSVTIERFIPDQHKDGGAYTSYTGVVKDWDNYERALVFEDGTRININTISNIQLYGRLETEIECTDGY